MGLVALPAAPAAAVGRTPVISLHGGDANADAAISVRWMHNAGGFGADQSPSGAAESDPPDPAVFASVMDQVVSAPLLPAVLPTETLLFTRGITSPNFDLANTSYIDYTFTTADSLEPGTAIVATSTKDWNLWALNSWGTGHQLNDGQWPGYHPNGELQQFYDEFLGAAVISKGAAFNQSDYVELFRDKPLATDNDLINYETTPNGFDDADIIHEFPSYILTPDTTYTLRVYPYASQGGNGRGAYDDFTIYTAPPTADYADHYVIGDPGVPLTAEEMWIADEEDDPVSSSVVFTDPVAGDELYVDGTRVFSVDQFGAFSIEEPSGSVGGVGYTVALVDGVPVVNFDAAPSDDLEDALRSLAFENHIFVPDVSTRTFVFTVADGTSSTTANTVITVHPPDTAPELEVTKDGPGMALVGETVTYTFEVSHAAGSDGSPVGDVAVEDDVAGTAAFVSGDTNSNGLLDDGETWVFEAIYTIQPSDTSPLVNTVTVTGEDREGRPTDPADDSHSTTVISPAPSITVDKSGTVAAPGGVGSVVTYEFMVENTGNVILTDIGFEDSLLGVVDIPGDADWSTGSSPTSGLMPGGTIEFELEHILTQADIDAGSVVNTAGVSGTPPSGDPVEGSDVETVTTQAGAPGITVSKSSSSTPSVVGDLVVYDFEITNTGNVTLSDIGFVDAKLDVTALPGGATWSAGGPEAGLPPGATITFSLPYTVDQTDVDAGSLVNEAGVAGTPPSGAPVTDLDVETIAIDATPAISVSKIGSLDGDGAVGDQVTYLFVITNTGNVTLTDIGFADDLLGLDAVPAEGVTWSEGSSAEAMLPGGTASFSATYTLTQPDVDAGSVVNTAHVTGTPPAGDPVEGSDVETVTTQAGVPGITVSKSSSSAPSVVGDQITYDFVIANTGNVTLTDLEFADAKLGVTAIPDNAAWTNGSPTAGLAPGGTIEFSLTYSVTQADVDAGSVVNAAAVTGVPPGGDPDDPVAGEDTETVDIDADPSIGIVKTGALAADTDGGVGDEITYEFVITNTGNVTLTDLEFADAKLGVTAIPDSAAWTNGSPTEGLAPSGTITFSLSSTVTQTDVDAGAVHNTATVSGVPPGGDPDDPVTGTDTETVPTQSSAPAIAVSKSSSSTPSVADDQITYDFVIRNTGNVTLTDVGFTDVKLGVSSIPDDAVWANGSPTTGLAPGGTITFSLIYPVTQADVDAGSVVNTATATGVPPGGDPDDPVTSESTETVGIEADPSIEISKTGALTADAEGAVDDVVTYDFVITNSGNVTLTDIDFADAKLGIASVPSGAVWTGGSAEDGLTPGGTVSFSATYTLTQGDIDAGSVVNVAEVTGTPPVGDPVEGSDVETVTTQAGVPGITVSKSSSSAPSVVGDEITYDFVITNTGNVTLTDLDFEDAKLGIASVPSGAVWTGGSVADGLAPGGTIEFSLTYPVTQADVDAGSVVNTATATGVPPGGDPDDPVEGEDTETVTIASSPSISVTKSSSSVPSLDGDEIVYDFLIRNTGNVTLTDIGFADAKLGTATVPGDAVWSMGSSPDAGLAPNGTITFSLTYPVTQADVDAGAVVNTATATGVPPGGDPDDPVEGEDTETVTITAAPSIAVSKTGAVAAPGGVDSVVTYNFVITNSGNVTLTDIGFEDPMLGAVAVPAGAVWTGGSAEDGLLPGGTVAFSLPYVLTQGDVDAGSVVNVAEVTGTPPSGDPVEGSDVETVTTQAGAPGITVSKSSSSAPSVVGDEITYDFVITNTGNVTLTDLDFADAKLGVTEIPDNAAWTNGSPTTGLAPGGTIKFSLTYAVTQADVDAGAVDNTAAASGTPPSGDPVEGADSETVLIDAEPAISVAKSSSSTPSTAGDQITYDFVIRNAGNVTLTEIGFADAKLGVTSVPDDAVWTNGSPTTGLAPGGTITFSLTSAVTQTDVDAGAVINTATATGVPPGGDPEDPTSDDDTETVTVTAAPSIAISKTGTLAADADGGVGDEITYQFVITNTGNVTLADIEFEDAKLGIAEIPADATWSAGSTPATGLAPNGTVAFELTYPVDQHDVDAGSVVNTAGVMGTPPVGDPVEGDDSDTVPTQPQAPAITLAKTSSSTPTAAGQTVTYDFMIRNTGNVTLTGITFDDPMLGATAIPDGASWSAGSSPETGLTPNGTVTFELTYTLTQADVDAGSVVNTAHATGTSPTGEPVGAEDSASVVVGPAPGISLVKTGELDAGSAVGDTITFSFLVTNTGNVTLADVAVTDPLPGLSQVRYGTWPSGQAGVLAPGQSVTGEASYTLTEADVDAGFVVNSATVTGVPPGGENPVEGDDGTTVELEIPIEPDDRNPAISLTKTAKLRGDGSEGDVIDYTLVATNTGDVTLTEVAIVDEKAGLFDFRYGAWPDASAPGTLEPGESVTATASYRITAADVAAGTVRNSASATGAGPDGTVTEDSDAATVTVGEVAETGFAALTPAVASLLLILLGATLVVVKRRREEARTA